MTDVILIEPGYYKRKKKTREQPQLGIAYIAAMLEQEGMKVAVIDASIENLSSKSIAETVRKLNPLVIGIGGCSDDRLGMAETIAELRLRCQEALIVGGGPHYSHTAEDALKNISELDVVVVGEGEHAMLELVKRYAPNCSHEIFGDVAGIAFRSSDGKIIHTQKHRILPELDALPRPAWHLFPMSRYQGVMSAGAPYRAIGIMSSRGCPFLCSFCANSLNRQVRYMSASRFVDEAQHLVDRYGFQALNFQDDSFSASTSHAREICLELLKRSIHLKWYCSLRVDHAAEDSDLLFLMKEAGCVALGFGIEFASDEILKKIEKNTTVEMIESALRNVALVRFQHVALFLMNSLPGQNHMNTIEGQLNLNRFHEILYGKYPYRCFNGGWTRLYPGTKLTAEARIKGNVFPPGFSWNTHYCSPYSEYLSLNSWSIPRYEDPHFPIRKIRNTLSGIEAYLQARNSLMVQPIRQLMMKAVRLNSWKIAIKAFPVWLFLKKKPQLRRIMSLMNGEDLQPGSATSTGNSLSSRNLEFKNQIGARKLRTPISNQNPNKLQRKVRPKQ